MDLLDCGCQLPSYTCIACQKIHTRFATIFIIPSDNSQPEEYDNSYDLMHYLPGIMLFTGAIYKPYKDCIKKVPERSVFCPKIVFFPDGCICEKCRARCIMKMHGSKRTNKRFQKLLELV